MEVDAKNLARMIKRGSYVKYFEPDDDLYKCCKAIDELTNITDLAETLKYCGDPPVVYDALKELKYHEILIAVCFINKVHLSRDYLKKHATEELLYKAIRDGNPTIIQKFFDLKLNLPSEWLLKQAFEKTKTKITFKQYGLQNQYRNCFLNSAFQLLIRCFNLNLSVFLYDFYNRLKEDNYNIYDLVRHYKSLSDSYIVGQNSDAGECLCTLIESIKADNIESLVFPFGEETLEGQDKEYLIINVDRVLYKGSEGNFVKYKLTDDTKLPMEDDNYFLAGFITHVNEHYYATVSSGSKWVVLNDTKVYECTTPYQEYKKAVVFLYIRKIYDNNSIEILESIFNSS